MSYIRKYNHAMDHMYPGGNYCYEFEYAFGKWEVIEKMERLDIKKRSTKARRVLDKAVIEEQLEDWFEGP